MPEALEGSAEGERKREERCFDKLSNREDRREKRGNGKREDRKNIASFRTEGPFSFYQTTEYFIP